MVRGAPGGHVPASAAPAWLSAAARVKAAAGSVEATCFSSALRAARRRQRGRCQGTERWRKCWGGACASDTAAKSQDLHLGAASLPVAAPAPRAAGQQEAHLARTAVWTRAARTATVRRLTGTARASESGLRVQTGRGSPPPDSKPPQPGRLSQAQTASHARRSGSSSHDNAPPATDARVRRTDTRVGRHRLAEVVSMADIVVYERRRREVCSTRGGRRPPTWRGGGTAGALLLTRGRPCLRTTVEVCRLSALQRCLFSRAA